MASSPRHPLERSRAQRPQVERQESEDELEKFRRIPKLACFRESPRPCVNQKLVDELATIRKSRFIEYGTENPKSISYAQATSALIGCPYEIETAEQAQAIPTVGEKISTLVGEFLATGQIQTARENKDDPALGVKAELMRVYGVGYHAAMDLYNAGIRSLDDLRRTGKHEQVLKYHDDINLPMSREEVESVANFIRLQLDRVEEGAHTVLCGGYRRGKILSNDIDLLITYPHEDGKERFVLDRVVKRLQAKGFIPPGGVLSHTNCASLRTIEENRPATLLDSLDKALIIFKHPANSTTRSRDIYRRVDLIVTRWNSYGAAVVGWSGSTQFERDLRKHAQTMGLKFDSGGLRTRATNVVVPTMMEEDVFRALKLPWIRLPASPAILTEGPGSTAGTLGSFSPSRPGREEDDAPTTRCEGGEGPWCPTSRPDSCKLSYPSASPHAQEIVLQRRAMFALCPSPHTIPALESVSWTNESRRSRRPTLLLLPSPTTIAAQTSSSHSALLLPTTTSDPWAYSLDSPTGGVGFLARVDFSSEGWERTASREEEGFERRRSYSWGSQSSIDSLSSSPPMTPFLLSPPLSSGRRSVSPTRRSVASTEPRYAPSFNDYTPRSLSFSSSPPSFYHSIPLPPIHSSPPVSPTSSQSSSTSSRSFRRPSTQHTSPATSPTELHFSLPPISPPQSREIRPLPAPRQLRTRASTYALVETKVVVDGVSTSSSTKGSSSAARCFAIEETSVLLRAWSKGDYYPEATSVDEMIKETGLSRVQIRGWFANRRHRAKGSEKQRIAATALRLGIAATA